MKEIKFRAKSSSNDFWMYGGIKADDSSAYIITEDYGISEVDPETVGQYIGLQDRNDRDIYEGDVLLTRSPFGEYIGYVAFRHGSFCVLGIEPVEGEYDIDFADIIATDDIDLHPFCAPIWESEMQSMKMHPCHECSEVIGNVYDNELFRSLPERHRALTEIAEQMQQAAIINFDFNRSVEKDNEDK